MPPATLNDLKHFFTVFLEKAILDITNQEPPNTPVSQDQSPAGPDMVRWKQLLVKLTNDECASFDPFVTANTAQSGLANNVQKEAVQVADEIDLNRPIWTTPDDFKSVEKWASLSRLKTVVETYESPTPLLTPFWQITDADIAGTKKRVNTRSATQWRPAVVRKTMLNMHLLSANELARNAFAQGTQQILTA
jgi:hypothetical protein